LIPPEGITMLQITPSLQIKIESSL